MGAAYGFGVGVAMGAVGGYQAARTLERNPWTGKPLSPDFDPLPLAPSRSLGYARSQLRPLLNNIDQFSADDIADFLKNNGFVDQAPASSPTRSFNRPHKPNSTLKVRLDPPDTKTKYYHMHINRGGDGYNIHLEIHPRKSVDVHIKHKQP